jgi:hypothetical protein
MDVLSGRMGRTVPSIEDRSECRLGVTFHGDDITSTCISKSERGALSIWNAIWWPARIWSHACWLGHHPQGRHGPVRGGRRWLVSVATRRAAEYEVVGEW